MIQSLRNIGRLMRAVFVLSRHDALFPREYVARMPPSLRLARRLLVLGRAVKVGDAPGVRLALALERLGPAYIKLGQILATRPDIVGADVCDALKQLQDRVPPFATDIAVATVEAGLGRPLEQVFRSFEPPVAAASIAQVHPAQTTDEPPRTVAVKIFRPGIEQEFARDISAFAFVARWAEVFSKEARRLRFRALVATLSASVALELDLRMEAAAASELCDLMADDPDFRVPAVDWSRTATRVLTTEWIDGVSVGDRQALLEAGHDPAQVAITVVRSFLTQALCGGFFHADMHQGNLFVDAEGRLVAVDFGIMGRLDAPMRRFMAETLAGFLARDYHRVAEVHFEAGFVPKVHSVENFAQALRAIGEPIFGRTARDVSMARLLQQLFDTTRRFDMELQPQLVLLQKTMVVVEGVARSLDPDFDIWEASRPVIAQWMADQIGPSAALRDGRLALKAMIGLARDLPQVMANLERVAQMLAGDGVKVHAESIERFARAQSYRIRHVQIALWLAALALLILAIGAVR
ncbi:MAG: 2-polyprenylphenol 6-hydroxylase [Alphaproteobacteria bacterium]|nr:2-polyprenylphenol 6-hydroxylase [Alphaproteobacteria bacterium]